MSSWRRAGFGGPSITMDPSAFAAAISAFIASVCALAGANSAAAAVASAPAIAARRLRSERSDISVSAEGTRFGVVPNGIIKTMLSAEKNARLTQSGPGTPGGKLLRRYWQALWPACDFTGERPKKRMKVMDEDLVVYRGEDGSFGCVAEHCTHRGCSLYYGFLEGSAIRCAYHGWKFEPDGTCVEQPFEPDGQHVQRPRAPARVSGRRTRRAAVRLHGPVAGAALAALGHAGAQGRQALVEIRPTLTCNWLQAQENTADTTHTYYLHGHTMPQKGLVRVRCALLSPADRFVRLRALRVGHREARSSTAADGSRRRSPAAADLPEHPAHPGRPRTSAALARADRRHEHAHHRGSVSPQRQPAKTSRRRRSCRWTYMPRRQRARRRVRADELQQPRPHGVGNAGRDLRPHPGTSRARPTRASSCCANCSTNRSPSSKRAASRWRCCAIRPRTRSSRSTRTRTTGW